MSDTAWAAAITAMGGVIATITAWFLSKGKTKVDFATQLREELRSDIQRWKTAAEGFEKRANDLHSELDSWRKKYDELYTKCNKMEDENFDLRRTNEGLTEDVGELQKQVDHMTNVLKKAGINGY